MSCTPAPAMRILLFAAVIAVTGVCANAERLPAGTEIVIRLDSDVDPSSSQYQDFRGALAYPVIVDGKQVLPADLLVEGEVRGSKTDVLLSPRYLYLPNGQRIDFNAAVKAIDRKKLRAEQKEGTIQPQGSGGGDTAQRAADMAMSGAAIGAMSTGTLKGMGIGAAIGAGAVVIAQKVSNGRKIVRIPAGTNLTLSLSRPIDIPDGVPQMGPNGPRDPDNQPPLLRRKDPGDIQP